MTCLNFKKKKKKNQVNAGKSCETFFYLVFKMAFFYTPKIRFEPIIIKAHKKLFMSRLGVTFLFVYINLIKMEVFETKSYRKSLYKTSQDSSVEAFNYTQEESWWRHFPFNFYLNLIFSSTIPPLEYNSLFQ